ncbi:hypothetical protein P154DRAFT_624547 [Amniculicola lignicola CBS 123094]|uniref:Uncharacterized protein n=1 Tax=Amniculicola lignicola CBS 123094 TaxID=1392246 RepID=A0A6A5W0D0_9PLEO|nr:hypothetical protein P154DRAFT_624547 [Amniculicola lignicola CBS 123094]
MSSALCTTTMPPAPLPDSSSDTISNFDIKKYIAIPHDSRSLDLDEERGFWGEYIGEEEENYERLKHVTEGCAALISIILGIAGALMVIRGAGIYFLSTTMPIPSPSAGIEMHFCFGLQPTSGIGPRTWEYISPADISSCDTSTMTMFSNPSEALKMYPGDAIIDAKNQDKHNDDDGRQGKHKGAKFLDGGIVDNMDDQDVGDDLAEEGKLRMPRPGSMHAGFGGPWKGRQRT